MPIELRQIFGWDPVLTVYARPGRLHRILRKILCLDLEAEYVTGSAVTRVPIAGDLHGVAFFQDRVENGLLGKAWRKFTPT